MGGIKETMNIVSVRETVKQMHKSRVLSDWAFKNLIYAPVFVYDRENMHFTPDEHEWCKENILDKERDQVLPVKLPYPFFMLWHPATKDRNATLFLVLSAPQSTDVEVDGKLEKRDVILTVASHDRYANEPRYADARAVKDPKKLHDCILMCSWTGHLKSGVIIKMWKDYKILNDIEKVAANDLKFMAANTLAILTRFTYDVMSKTSAVIKATPKGEGKSVEWQLARTHYCILNKKQAMKIRDVKKAITTHDIKRAAGWRIAHFRVLRAECFTKKRGMKVPVKEAWVGPESWIGLDDKIYKVML